MILFTGSDLHMIRKKKGALSGAIERITDVIPSSDEVRDEVGNLIAQLLSGPKRWEKRIELRKKLEALKDNVCSSRYTESVIDELEGALVKFDELMDDALYGAKRCIKRARLLAVSWLFAIGAVIIDNRWKPFFEALM